MAPLAITLTAGTAAVVIGEATRQRPNLLAYRRPDGTVRPDPGRRWWVPVATAAAVIALTVRFLPTRPHVLWMLVPQALAGPWLAAVGLDVRRLPDRVLLPLLAWQALVTAGLFITGHRDTGLAVVIGAVGCLIGLWSLWVKTLPIPPCRSRAMSSMESAPVAIPATSEVTFNPAFAPLSVGSVSRSCARSVSPARWASLTSGTRPAAQMRLGSSNAAAVTGRV